MSDLHPTPDPAGRPSPSANDATAWQRLARAACTAKAAAPAQDESAPYGFSTRVVSLWKQAREEERRLALWQRISLRTAFATVALSALVVVATMGRESSDPRPLLEPPDMSLPGL